MADRLPQYPMLPNFNNNSLLQQQQAHQQQQQQQQQLQHQSQSLQDGHPGISQSSMDQARVWQQMQQFRPPGAADMNAANPAQFAEMMKRTQSLNQAHAARSQPLNQQQPQQFGMGSGLSQMNSGPPVIGGSAQQQPFHDTSSPHPQPSHIPTGFPNMAGMPTGNPNQPQRNPQNILQGFQPPGVSRQLELMNMAQNQQPQNGPVNINKFNPQQLPQHQLNQLREREQQQQQQFQSTSMNPAAELFSSPAMSNEALRRPSPHPGNMQQPPTGQQEPRIAGMSLADMSNRVAVIRPQVTHHEAMLHGLQQQHNLIRGTPQEPQIIARIKEVQGELNRRKEYLAKLLVAIPVLQKQKAAANANGGPSGAGQQPWISHPQPFDNNPNARNPAAQPSPSQLQANSIQSSPSLAHSQSQANHLVNQGFVPQRSGTTPQHSGQPAPQHTGNPFNSLQPPIGGQFPFSGNSQQPAAGPSQPSQMASSQGGNVMNNFGNGPNLGMIPPLDKARFDVAFKNFSLKRNLKLDNRLLSIESGPVELHRLHVEVLKEGGFNKVDQKDMWNIIGGRLGSVQFPGTDTEPAKSGPGVAQQLAHIYKEYLALFEQWYTAQAIENSKRMMAAGNIQQPHINSAVGGRWNAQQMQQVVQMSHLSVAELQAQGVDEKTIAFVETNRASLQRTYQEQKTFQNKMRTANLTQPAASQVIDQNGPQIPRASVMTSSSSFPAGSPAQHTAAAIAARQQFFQQQQQLLQAQQGQQQLQQPPIQGGQTLLQGPRIQQPQNMPPRLISAEAIMKIKQDYTTINIPAMQPVNVPVEHRLEFNQLLEQLYRQCSDADQKLQMIFAVVKQEDLIRKLIAIICTIQSQRSMLSTVSNPRYIVTFETLKNMSGEMQRILELFTSMFNAFRQQRQQMAMNHMQSQGGPVAPQQQQQHAGTNPIVPPMPMMGMHDMVSQSRPPVSHQLPITAGPSTQQQQIASSLRPPPVLQAPPGKRTKTQQQPPSSNANAVSTPSPAPVQAASTPIANAATPTATASSPPAAPTKSPKTRAPPKPKAPPASRRRPSKAAPTPAAAPEAAQPVASSSTPNAKRPREEDSLLASVDSSSGSTGSAAVANEPSPPKRAKTEWESPPTEEMKKKNEVVENIKTEDDAAAFLVEQMTDLIKMAGGDGQSSLPTGISETLEMILKGYGTVPESVDGASGALMGGEPSGVALKEATPPPAAMTDAFDEFFDFSFGITEDDDNNSKAPTPDLVSSSSTNPSPESNHESDVSHHIFPSNSSSSTTDIKTEEPMDPLRLGPWKNIDGGEGAYYQTNEWKWDSPMPSLDQPWAVFNS